jgi:hypothetical protein
MKNDIRQAEHPPLAERPAAELMDNDLQQILLKTGLFKGTHIWNNLERIQNERITNAAINDHWTSFAFMLNPEFEHLIRVPRR